MRVETPQFRFLSLAFLLCILIYGGPILGGQTVGEPEAGGVEPAHAAEAAPALVFLSQRPLSDRAWAALFVAVRASLQEAAAEVPALDTRVELIRGDALDWGAVVPRSVTVYLHGDCTLHPMPGPFPMGEPLGWVMKVGPWIQPMIHVECTPIGQALAQSGEWMSRDQRMAAMSGAMARVILHEWAHVATQSSAHGAEGITKARFGVADLIPRRCDPRVCVARR